jgi:DNA-binding PadR family transcriptional regulator
VILRLLEEKPRHGYEIIKELEGRFGGSYVPSPGTVYPTLTMLEDLGYARAVPEEGGKKVYEITDEGRKYLAEHSTTVDDIFERIAKFVEGFTDTPMMELNQAFQRLARTTYKTATGHLGEKARAPARHHPTGRRRGRGSHQGDAGDAAAGRVVDGRRRFATRTFGKR